MECVGCGSAAVSERCERTARGYRRYRCRACGKQFNERSDGVLNRTQYPSDVIALVVLWRLRYKLALRDLPEMFLIRGIVFSHEAVRDWEAKLTPAMAESFWRRRRGKAGRSWYVDEMYIKGSTGTGVISIVPSIAPARWSSDVQRAPRHGRREGVLRAGLDSHRHHARSGHHGWA
jgi:hypothetical protein